ncbi:hypothetical protein WME89_05835 [Sorangium sp. So ce321]|uniref:hypothetical protein n=1 Tax=Sorangium sp. So ce321 TaxID=3133300 RepID=UPI003F5F4C81
MTMSHVRLPLRVLSAALALLPARLASAARVEIASPQWGDVAHPLLHIDATCTEVAPASCADMWVVIHSAVTGEEIVIAGGPNRIDMDVDVSPLSRAGQPMFVFIRSGSAGGEIYPVFAEDSPRLTPLAKCSGQILDFDETRLLCIDLRGAISIVDRSTNASRIIAGAPDPDQWGLPRGYLTSFGAVVHTLSTNDPWSGGMVLYESHDEVIRTIQAPVPGGPPVGVVDDHVLWFGGRVYREGSPGGYQLSHRVMDLATGELVELLDIRDPGFTEDGAVVYAAAGGFYRYQSGTTTLLADLPHARPVTDGVNLAYASCSIGQCATRLITPDGDVPLGVSAPEYTLRSPEPYQLRAGYTAFTRKVLDDYQVWVRTPAGEEHQVSMAGSSLMDEAHWIAGHDLVSDTGEVVFPCVLGAGTAAPRRRRRRRRRSSDDGHHEAASGARLRNGHRPP